MTSYERTQTDVHFYVKHCVQSYVVVTTKNILVIFKNILLYFKVKNT